MIFQEKSGGQRTETGESMGVPNKKLKKLIMITGIALGVYAGMKYLLPLVIPFFLALALAEAIRPQVCWLQKKLTIHTPKKAICLPQGILGGIILTAAGAVLFWICFVGGKKLLQEGRLLLDNLPQIMKAADHILTGWCQNLEQTLHLESGSIVRLAQEALRSLGNQAAARLMPYLMGSSMLWLGAFARVLIFLVVLFFGTVLALQESEEIHRYFRRSLFRQEYREMVRILKAVTAAYGKTQLLILMGTILICTGGLFLLDNPYYGLLGVIIGILDALPFIGTGTVLFPWAAICFVQGNTARGIFLLIIYGICYLLRQLMESRMMGRQAGLSPFLTLASIYVGIQLFGIPGVLLGPLYFLILRESIV